MQKEWDAALTGSFYVQAELKTAIGEVASNLNKIGYLKRLFDSQLLKYEILEKDSDKGSVLELSEGHIALRFFFKSQDARIYKQKFIVFLSLIGILDNFYDIKLSNLYKYLVEILNQNWQNSIKDQNEIINALKARIITLNESNCTISYQLIKLSKENKSLSMDLSIYKEFCKDVITFSKEKGTSGFPENYVPLTTLGIELKLIQKIETLLNNMS